MAGPRQKAPSKRPAGGAPRKSSSKSTQKSSRKTPHGGRRPGAGRPPKPDPVFFPNSQIDRAEVESLARLGTERDTIIVALRVPRELLSDSDFVREFDAAIAYGTAWLEVDMLRERKMLAGAEKVSATIAGLRNFKGWDRADRKKGDGKANQQGALSDLEQVIDRVGKKR